MVRAVRPFLVVLILLSLGLYGAAARAWVVRGTEMVICSAEGATTIWLGLDGTPIKAPPSCGECLDCITLAAGNAPDPVSVLRPKGQSVLVWQMALDGSAPALHWPATLPRGPPAATKTGNIP